MMLVTTAVLPAVIPDTVNLDTGLVSGMPGTNAEVRVFKGIPFVAPPSASFSGRHRSRPRRGRVGRGDQFGPRCMQSGCGQGAQPVSEDCLYLNVWTAAASRRRSAT